VLSYICENYFNSQIKDLILTNPKVIDFTKFTLYKTPDIIIKNKSINEIIIKDNYPIDESLTSLKNIKIVTMYTQNKNLFNNNIVEHKIANMQNIYSLEHIGIDAMCNYIYENNFLMRYLHKNVPNGIENINIPHDFRFRFSFDDFPILFPITTKIIRINIIFVKQSVKYCADICENLPINLVKLIICYCNYERTNYYTENFDLQKELLNNIKLPFGCNLIIENFVY
jgi:hypothetical protein